MRYLNLELERLEERIAPGGPKCGHGTGSDKSKGSKSDRSKGTKSSKSHRSGSSR